MNFLNIINKETFTMAQAEEAAKNLKKAMKGMGTDEAAVIKEIVAHTNAERQLVKEKYLTMYGKHLEEDLKSEINGHFLEGVLALLQPTDEFEATCVRNAIKGMGTDEQVLIQHLCSKEAKEIQALKAAYKKLYSRDLEKDIEGEQNGPLGRILVSIVAGGRPDKGIDASLASIEAGQLNKAAAGMGTDEIEFVRILCSNSFAQLRATFETYAKVYNTDIEKTVKDEMSGDLKQACLAIIKSAKSTPTFFAEQLNEAMAGAGTKDKDLIRLLVSRAEKDLRDIKVYYKHLYKKSLYDVVKGELSGDYEKLFLALIGKD